MAMAHSLSVLKHVLIPGRMSLFWLGTDFPAHVEASLAPTSTTILVPQDESSIQAAIDAAQDGDLVLVSPGAYVENLTLSGKTITLASLYHTTGDENAIAETIINGQGSTVIAVDPSVGPADNAEYTQNQRITFSGEATDAEDGDISESLVWTSDLDGTIGAGGPFARSDLSVGMHTI